MSMDKEERDMLIVLHTTVGMIKTDTETIKNSISTQWKKYDDLNSVVMEHDTLIRGLIKFHWFFVCFLLSSFGSMFYIYVKR